MCGTVYYINKSNNYKNEIEAKQTHLQRVWRPCDSISVWRFCKTIPHSHAPSAGPKNHSKAAMLLKIVFVMYW